MMQDLRKRQPIVEINRFRREASIDGVPLALGEKEYQLLQAIATMARNARPPQAPSISELLSRYHVAKR